jgi:hypothetical protein
MTTQNKVPHEKLIVVQLIKKFPCLLSNLKVHYPVHKNSPLGPILNRTVNSITSYSAYFPATPGFPKLSLQVSGDSNSVYAFSSLMQNSFYSTHLTALHLVALTMYRVTINDSFVFKTLYCPKYYTYKYD